MKLEHLSGKRLERLVAAGNSDSRGNFNLRNLEYVPDEIQTFAWCLGVE